MCLLSQLVLYILEVNIKVCSAIAWTFMHLYCHFVVDVFGLASLGKEVLIKGKGYGFIFCQILFAK